MVGSLTSMTIDGFRVFYRAHFSAGVQARSSTKIGGLTGANMVFEDLCSNSRRFFDGLQVMVVNRLPLISLIKVLSMLQTPSFLMSIQVHFIYGYGSDYLVDAVLINTHVDKNNAWKGWLKAGIKLLGLMCFFILLCM